MKDNIAKIFQRINDAEKILESSVINEIEKNKNFSEVFVISDGTKLVKKLDLTYTVRKINLDKYYTIINDKDNGESIKMLKLNDIGSATTDISPKGTFIKLKKSLFSSLQKVFKDSKIR
jgi:hypothetical protein